MPTRTLKTVIALAACHWLGDCCGGVWPVYKYLAGLDLARAGLIATAAMFVGSALQPLFGVLSDRGGQRVLILAGTALCSLSMLLGPVSRLQSAVNEHAWYGLMLAVMLTVSIGAGMFHPAATSAAGSTRAARRGTMVAVFIAAGMFGFSLSQGLFSLVFTGLHGHTEWMLLPAAAIVGLGVRWCHPGDGTATAHASLRQVAAAIMQIRGPLVLLYLYQTLISALSNGFTFIMPEFTALRGCPSWFVHGGGYFFWIGGASLVMVISGHLADRWGGKPVLVACTALAVALFYAIILPGALPLWAYAVLLTLGGGFTGATNPLGIMMGQHLAPGSASVISGILMGTAWATGSLGVWGVAALAQRPGLGPPGALLWLGGCAIAALPLALILPRGSGWANAADPASPR